MKLDEFAFFNQQLAAMLRNGLPLEGALRQLSAGMRDQRLKAELARLEADLAAGTPLDAALPRRALPDLYKRMLLVGVHGNDLPGILTLLADYYQQRQNILTRLKGLMVYPVIVLLVALIVSGGIAFMWSVTLAPTFREIWGVSEGRPLPAFTQMLLQPMNSMWAPPVVISLLFLAVLLAICVRRWRSALRWRLPAFKESSLAQTAAALHLMLRSGVPLPEAIGLLEQLETGNRAGRDLSLWKSNLMAGMARFADVAKESRAFPPLFVWLVGNAGEDITAGLKSAAEIYQARAKHRTEMILYAALPACVLLLGLMILMQAWFAMGAFLPLLDLMNNLGG